MSSRSRRSIEGSGGSSHGSGGDSGELSLNDPVLVETSDGGAPLQGLVAYLGEVSFSSSKEDWVGVRLTGPSIGRGKNDGSVKGVRYFEDVGRNNGVFVKKTSVTKRQLSRLEELRLKRELRGMASGGSKSPPPPGASSSASQQQAHTKRLKEIREARDALHQDKTMTRSTSSNSIGSVASIDRSSHGAADRDSLAELAQKLKESREENASLQKSLEAAQKQAADAREQVERLEAEKEHKKKLSMEEGEDEEEGDDAEKVLTLRSALRDSESERERVEGALGRALEDVGRLQEQIEADRDAQQTELDAMAEQRSQLEQKLNSVERELQAANDQAAARTASDAAHYKERAKLQAEVGAMQRKLADKETEKMDLDTTIEELALDRDALQEEKESLEDNMEEVKIDMESLQIELDETRLELEETKERYDALVVEREAAAGVAAAAVASDGLPTEPKEDSSKVAAATSETDEIARALSIQNARLREALVRLREQTMMEKMDLTRQVRNAEKDAATGQALIDEVTELRAAKSRLEESVSNLMETVDQGSAFETMVEDLSDRVMSLEDEAVVLRSTIRDLEDAADVAAEMEEVQADENKALLKEVEARNTAILNLEVAIKMQRRREEDFQRTVGNYRASIEKLHQEKKALLALREGGEGEKTHLIATSQKALAQAAQLVADATKARRREADAAIDKVDAQIASHLSDRLESTMPEAVAGPEVAAIKGELLLAKVASKASLSLVGVLDIFGGVIHKALEVGRDAEVAGIAPEEESKEGEEGKEEGESKKEEAKEEAKAPERVALSDAAVQGVATMVHQTKFAHLAIDASADSLRVLYAGQWPDILTTRASAELSASAVQSMPALDAALTQPLRLLKEDGGLSPHRCALTALDRGIREARHTLEIATSAETGDPLMPAQWTPPGWEVVRDASRAKYWCVGAMATVASAIRPPANVAEGVSVEDDYETETALLSVLGPLLKTMEQVSSETTKVSQLLANAPVHALGDDRAELAAGVAEWKRASQAFFEAVVTALCGETAEGRSSELVVGKVADCVATASATVQAVMKVSSKLRSSKVPAQVSSNRGDRRCNPLSPEIEDPWAEVYRLVRSVRAFDGDAEEINSLLRARSVEAQLSEAVENEAKLTTANARVASLEKTLVTRAKEISLQNSRLSDLEKLLAVTPPSAAATAAPAVAAAASPGGGEEVKGLQEENRVLTEAMDVLQGQLDEYEREIRSLKESARGAAAGGSSSVRGGGGTPAAATPGGRRTVHLTPRKTLSFEEAIQPSKTVSLEAAFFRPALQSARSEAAAYKARAVAATLAELPPLAAASKTCTNSSWKNVGVATAQWRLTRASVQAVNLTQGSGRGQLRREARRCEAALERLRQATAAARKEEEEDNVASLWNPPPCLERDVLVGRVTVAGQRPARTVPLTVDSTDLQALHSHLLLQ